MLTSNHRCCYTVSRKKLDVKNYIAATPRTVTEKIYVAATVRTTTEKIYVAAIVRTATEKIYVPATVRTATEKNCFAATPVTVKRFFFVFAVLKQRIILISFCDLVAK